MRIARWRIALAAGPLLTLGIVGIGMVQAGASPARPAPATDVGAADAAFAAELLEGQPLVEPPQGEPSSGLRERLRERLLERLDRLVNVQVTLDLPDDGIVTVRFDHGTVGAVATGSFTIREADGSTITLTTDGETRLRKDGERQELSALKVGDEVVVRSRKVDDAFVARGILVPPADAAGSTGG